MGLIDEITKGESERLEFKEVPNCQSDKWLKTVVAFDNCRGGRILFGVSNSREIKGLDGNLFAIKYSISDAVASACAPPIPIQVGITTVVGKPIIVLEVQEGIQTPYYIKSKGDVNGVYVRYDATTRIADEYALQDLRVEGSGKSYDSRVCRGFKVTAEEIGALCKRMYVLAQENALDEAERKLIKPSVCGATCQVGNSTQRWRRTASDKRLCAALRQRSYLASREVRTLSGQDSRRIH